MIGAIKKYFDTKLLISADSAEVDADHRLKVSTAALLIEVMRADHHYQDDERQEIVNSLQKHFELDTAEVNQLIRLAEDEVENSVDHYEFTSLIKNTYSAEQRISIIELMWQVAYADKHLEKYEEALIRKIAELIYVRHSDFIASKHRVLDRLNKN